MASRNIIRVIFGILFAFVLLLPQSAVAQSKPKRDASKDNTAVKKKGHTNSKKIQVPVKKPNSKDNRKGSNSRHNRNARSQDGVNLCYPDYFHISHQQWYNQEYCMEITGRYVFNYDYNTDYVAVAFIIDQNGRNVQSLYEAFRLDDGSFYATSDVLDTGKYKNFRIVFPIETFNFWSYTKQLTLLIALYCPDSGTFVECSSISEDFYVRYNSSGMYTSEN